MVHIHPLQKVKPCQVLETCFKAYGYCCRPTGLLPIKIHHASGRSEFKFLSGQMLCLFVHVVIYIGLGVVYAPIYHKQLLSLQGNDVIFVSEVIFIGGQAIGSMMGTLLIPLIARGVSRFWNDLLVPIEFIVVNGCGKTFHGPYRRSRFCLGFFTILMFIYAYISWTAINPGALCNKTLLWLEAGGFILFFIFCACHLVHVLTFVFFVFMLKHCFEGLELLIENLEKESKTSLPRIDKPYLHLQRASITAAEVLPVYKALCKVARGISRTFGFYILLEVVVMITSILMNVFTIFSDFQQRDPFSTSLSLLCYSMGLLLVCESGEHCAHSARRCYDRFREFAHSSGAKEAPIIAGLRLPEISAAQYFIVNRRLASSVAATFATNIVVIVQFKLNSIKHKEE